MSLNETDRFYRLFDGFLKYFFYSRGPDGERLSVCPKIAAVLGYSPAEFQAHWSNYLTANPINEKAFKLLTSRVRLAEDVSFEVEVYHKEGHFVWLKAHESPLFDSAGKFLAAQGVFVDVTEEKRLEKELRLNEARFREMSQSSPVGIFQIDPDDFYIYVNPAWQAITGRSLLQTLGGKWWEIVYPEDREKVFWGWAEAESEEREFCGECRIVKPGGGTGWIQLNSKFFYHDQGKITYGIIMDITERREAQQKQEILITELTALKMQLEIAARTDPLTELPNRRGFDERIQQEMFRFERHKRPFCLVIADIDFFKKINDSCGHDGGDFVLVRVAKILKKLSRKQDTFYRWGGEEFLAILPETGLPGARILAEKIRSRIESEDFEYRRRKIPVTMSFGIGAFNAAGLNVDDCLKQADLCLYEAKRAGRNRVVAAPANGR